MGMTYREPALKGKNKLNIKYDGEELYQEGIGKTTVKQSRRVEFRTGKVSRCPDALLLVVLWMPLKVANWH
jgi:hypothetical protein